VNLDSLTVGSWIRITDPVGYSDEPFTEWRQITWLSPRHTWVDRDRITVGFADNTGQLRLDWPHDRIETSADQPT
jgi:hypothetical protein